MPVRETEVLQLRLIIFYNRCSPLVGRDEEEEAARKAAQPTGRGRRCGVWSRAALHPKSEAVNH